MSRESRIPGFQAGRTLTPSPSDKAREDLIGTVDKLVT